MTYCLAIKLDSGLVFAGDTRTNAGVDRVATFRKLYTFGNGTSHAMALLSSGNLATTQMLIERLQRSVAQANGLYSDSSMFDTAARIGSLLGEIVQQGQQLPMNQGIDFSANVILGGQIRGEAPRLFHIYPQGNFLEATAETPFFQIGEEKYGKPILDRIIDPGTTLDRAVTCALLSLDSTMKSNMTVDMPLDLLVYPRDSFSLARARRIEREDEDFNFMRKRWSEGLRQLIDTMPPFALPEA